MPLQVDSLTEQSEMQAIKDAISKSIEACMSEPIPAGTDVTLANKQKWCAGKAYGIARQKTGKMLGGQV